MSKRSKRRRRVESNKDLFRNLRNTSYYTKTVRIARGTVTLEDLSKMYDELQHYYSPYTVTVNPAAPVEIVNRFLAETAISHGTT